jgi:DNA-binding response OmpR family regulator
MPPDDPSAGTGFRVLVVDDELLVADHLQMLLEDAGYTVVGPVATVEKALAAVRGEHLDGVLLDANLNGRSSAPIADELRKRGVPFVVVTGYGKLQFADPVLNDAPRLSKPFNGAEFENKLATAFARDR